MKAIIKTQGRQFAITEGSILEVNQYINKSINSTFFINEILCITDNENTVFGQPIIQNYTVMAKILENKKGDKVKILKRKRRKGYTLRKGHRQQISIIRVESIKQRIS